MAKPDGSDTRRFFAQGLQRTTVAGGQPTTLAYFTFRDHLGSVRELTNAAGILQKRYAYDPWGRRTETYNGAGSFDPLVGFTGHYFQGATGLHFAFYRAYSAEHARWMNKDPLGDEGGLNTYEYAAGNPVPFSDPLGLFSSGLGGGWGCVLPNFANFPLHLLTPEAKQAIEDDCGICPPVAGGGGGGGGNDPIRDCIQRCAATLRADLALDLLGLSTSLGGRVLKDPWMFRGMPKGPYTNTWQMLGVYLKKRGLMSVRNTVLHRLGDRVNPVARAAQAAAAGWLIGAIAGCAAACAADPNCY